MDIINRDVAHASGLKRYFTGVPCKRGHVVERYVSTGACKDCLHRAADPTAGSAYPFHAPLRAPCFKDASGLEAQAAFRLMESAGWYEAAVKALRADPALLAHYSAHLTATQRAGLRSADTARAARRAKLQTG
jgi:hypothetical protein